MGRSSAYPSISKGVPQKCEAAGLNQTQLGKAVGRPQSFVSNYERAQRRLDLPDLILVCRAMGLEPAELLRRLDPVEK